VLAILVLAATLLSLQATAQLLLPVLVVHFNLPLVLVLQPAVEVLPWKPLTLALLVQAVPCRSDPVPLAAVHPDPSLLPLVLQLLGLAVLLLFLWVVVQLVSVAGYFLQLNRVQLLQGVLSQ